MSSAFEYRPKFVDIRVKKPDAEAPRRTRYAGEAEAGQCDHIGCARPGLYRAPKGRDHAGQYWRFCLDHVTEYNKRWNYFSGMSDGEWADYQAREEVGHRPTWTFRGGRLDKISAAVRGFRGGGDPFSLFGSGDPATARAPQRRRLTRMQAKAFEDLSLEEGATGDAIRARYAELVKRWHPDSNGGDRSAEEALHRVLTAYQTLKAAGLV
ncbi:MAG: J domain-containing protein [Hyphomonadaceae bacterium]|nr:J domain-containing protein [Hyphomonadaceae bacterium]